MSCSLQPREVELYIYPEKILCNSGVESSWINTRDAILFMNDVSVISGSELGLGEILTG